MAVGGTLYVLGGYGNSSRVLITTVLSHTSASKGVLSWTLKYGGGNTSCMIGLVKAEFGANGPQGFDIPLDVPQWSLCSAHGYEGQGHTRFVVGNMVGEKGAKNVEGFVLFFAVTDPDDGALWADLEGDADRGPVFEGLGWAAIGVGLASVAGAIVWLVVGQPDEDDSVAFTGNGFRTRWGTL